MTFSVELLFSMFLIVGICLPTEISDESYEDDDSTYYEIEMEMETVGPTENVEPGSVYESYGAELCERKLPANAHRGHEDRSVTTKKLFDYYAKKPCLTTVMELHFAEETEMLLKFNCTQHLVKDTRKILKTTYARDRWIAQCIDLAASAYSSFANPLIAKALESYLKIQSKSLSKKIGTCHGNVEKRLMVVPMSNMVKRGAKAKPGPKPPKQHSNRKDTTSDVERFDPIEGDPKEIAQRIVDILLPALASIPLIGGLFVSNVIGIMGLIPSDKRSDIQYSILQTQKEIMRRIDKIDRKLQEMPAAIRSEIEVINYESAERIDIWTLKELYHEWVISQNASDPTALAIFGRACERYNPNIIAARIRYKFGGTNHLVANLPDALFKAADGKRSQLAAFENIIRADVCLLAFLQGMCFAATNQAEAAQKMGRSKMIETIRTVTREFKNMDKVASISIKRHVKEYLEKEVTEWSGTKDQAVRIKKSLQKQFYWVDVSGVIAYAKVENGYETVHATAVLDPKCTVEHTIGEYTIVVYIGRLNAKHNTTEELSRIFNATCGASDGCPTSPSSIIDSRADYPYLYCGEYTANMAKRSICKNSFCDCGKPAIVIAQFRCIHRFRCDKPHTYWAGQVKRVLSTPCSRNDCRAYISFAPPCTLSLQ